MNTQLEFSEGTIPFRGYQVWYRIVGSRSADAGKVPLVCLHGGPGVPHDYLEPLEKLATTGRQVVFYDQLGCGNSDQPHDPALWSVDLFLDELRAICSALELERIHLLGHSWGGMLAMEYALIHPTDLVSLILASTPASVPQFIEEARRLLDALPTEIQSAIREHEEAGTTDSPAYQEATMAFYRRHLCRVDPWPDYFVRTFEKFMTNPTVYSTMWGPSEFCATGLLKEWSMTDRLGEIRLPTLLTSGRYDEVTPATVEPIERGISNAEWVMFEECSHMSHIEDPGRYADVVGAFLNRVEAGAPQLAAGAG